MIRYSCYQNTAWRRDVEGSKGAQYLVWWRYNFDTGLYNYVCSCPAYTFRKPVVVTCKHIEMVKGERCTWNADYSDPVETTVCPLCGGLAVATEVLDGSET